MTALAVDPFRDVSFIQRGRQLEVEAVEGGRSSNEFSTCPASVSSDDESPVAGIPVDDIQETEEHVNAVQQYVPFAREAFAERGLVYPFEASASGSALGILPPHRGLAKKCSELSDGVGVGGDSAKTFELRAFRALHLLIGGWAVCVGSPRKDRTGPARGVTRFRELLRETERGDYVRSPHARSGDYGLDGVWILGREWGGPLVYLQVKNSSFNRQALGADFLRISDALYEWFGHRISQHRHVVTVCAVNTVFTQNLKCRAYGACQTGAGFHVIDAVDILFAESRPVDYLRSRDTAIEF